METVYNNLSASRNLIIETGQSEKYLKSGCDFIDDEAIVRLLREQVHPEPGRIRDILQKSLSIETLSLEETALLLSVYITSAMCTSWGQRTTQW